MRQMTADELHRYLHSAETAPLLLDVREPHEYAYCRIEGSVNIPMNSVPGRLNEIDQAATVVSICHHGMRSAAVADYLLGHGYPEVINLQGGIDAWSRLVDPSVPRY
ncbi:MAG: rhodanese-like domain-containing protein [Methylococcus sp.]